MPRWHRRPCQGRWHYAVSTSRALRACPFMTKEIIQIPSDHEEECRAHVLAHLPRALPGVVDLELKRVERSMRRGNT